MSLSLTVVDGGDQNPIRFFTYHKQLLLRVHQVSSVIKLPKVFQANSLSPSDPSQCEWRSWRLVPGHWLLSCCEHKIKLVSHSTEIAHNIGNNVWIVNIYSSQAGGISWKTAENRGSFPAGVRHTCPFLGLWTWTALHLPVVFYYKFIDTFYTFVSLQVAHFVYENRKIM